jgi:hypothetical protein
MKTVYVELVCDHCGCAEHFHYISGYITFARAHGWIITKDRKHYDSEECFGHHNNPLHLTPTSPRPKRRPSGRYKFIVPVNSIVWHSIHYLGHLVYVTELKTIFHNRSLEWSVRKPWLCVKFIASHLSCCAHSAFC